MQLWLYITFLGVNAFEAIGIALASDVLASATSAITYGKNKNVDIKNSKWLIGGVLSFTLVGAFAAHQLPAATMGNFTVYASLIMGIVFIVKSFKKDSEEEKVKKELKGKLKIIVPLLCGIQIGFICGFIGAGGGMIMLILLTTVLGYELKTAVGTSVFIMTFTALFGACSHFYLNQALPNLMILGLCALSTFTFATLGAKFANKATPKILNRSTGIVLTTLGLFMILAI